MKNNDIDYWIRAMLASNPGVSDLIFTVGRTLQVESDGELLPVDVQPPLQSLTPFQAETFAMRLIGSNKRLLRDLITNGSCDLSYSIDETTRFRVNVFTQKLYLTTVLRRLATTVPSIASMGFPEAFGLMARELNGLILFTGGTGTGKTTSLATLLNQINHERAVHVITLEDPIEYIHEHGIATFNQRELGNDFSSYATGLRSALRQAPKIILVGEIRDRETMEIALSAAETGHLVMSTLHTIDAGQSINRVISMFHAADQAQVRNRLADTIRWVVSQRLLPKIAGGRIAAIEILRTSIRVRDLIVNGETEEKTFYHIMRQGSTWGMRTFDQHILELFKEGIITEDTAKRFSSHRSEVNRGIDQIKAVRGEETTQIDGLSMEIGDENKNQLLGK